MTTFRNKYHINNYIDENFQKGLIPLNILQHVFFLSKYTIRNNFIHTKSYAYTVIISILFPCLVIFAVYSNFPSENGLTDVYYAMILHSTLYCIECIILFFNNIYVSKLTVQLILNVQKILRIFKQPGNDLKRWEIENWIALFCNFLIYFLIITICVNFEGFTWSTKTLYGILYIFALIYFDVNIICAFRYMNLVNRCFKLWMYNFQIYSDRISQISISATRNIQIDLKTYFDAYNIIIDSFNTFKRIFQLSVRRVFYIIL